MRYRDRADAGRALAESLARYAHAPATTVVGLARGGVVVGAAVAHALGLPLDVLVVRKLGLPWAPEVAFGAIAPGDVDVRDAALAGQLRPGAADAVAADERAELLRRSAHYGRDHLDLTGRQAIVVDDGLATGASARAGLASARAAGATRIVFAVPVGAPDGLDALTDLADEVVCPHAPDGFHAVSAYYRSFTQVTDAEVMALLD